jgi:uncharacterized membrane protein
MKPLIVLIASFLFSLLIVRLISGKFIFSFPARIGLSIMLCFTAMGHFMFTKGMSMMLPDFIPMKTLVIYFTGVIEIAAAICLHFSSIRKATGWLLILFFIILLPANIKAASESLNYETGTYDGNGLEYLWFRIPLQILFIVWVYLSACTPEKVNENRKKNQFSHDKI